MTSLTRFLSSGLMLAIVILFQSSPASSQLPETKTKGTGSISGRVTIGDKPAPGILVTVSGSNLQTPGQATSDAEGRYRIGGLSAGQFTVTSFAPTYVLPPANFMLGSGKSINLSSGESIDNIDFKLTKGGVITGRVTDAYGRPVIEERISLVHVDEKGALTREQWPRVSNFQVYQTDDRGVYRIFGLAAGHYKVSVGEEAGRSAVLRAAGYYQKTYYPDTTDISKASIVDLNEGGEAKNIDIKLGRRATTFSASGRIVDADAGQPLAGVQYSFGLIQKSENESYVEGSASPGTPTNAQGEFRLVGLDPGRYVVFVSSPRFGRDSATASKFYSDPVTFEVVDSDITNLEIKAQRVLSISGVVVLEGTADKNVLAKLSWLTITAGINPGPTNGVNIMFGNGGSSSINPDGSFQINGLSPGRAQLNIRPLGPGDLGFTISRIEHERRVSVRGADVTGIELALLPLASISGRVNLELDPKLNCGRHRDTALRETLINVNRNPVELNTKDKSASAADVWVVGPAIAETVPNDQGEVVLRNLVWGSYHVEARPPGAGWHVRAIDLGEPEQKPSARRPAERNIPRDGIAVKLGDRISGLTVVISEGGATLRGRLSVAEGQQVPKNMRAYLVPAELEASENVLRFFEARAESDGTFAIGNIAPGRYWIIARPTEENDPTKLKSVRQDSAFRAKVLHEAESLKKEISFKPCERTVDYNLQFAPTVPPKQ